MAAKLQDGLLFFIGQVSGPKAHSVHGLEARAVNYDDPGAVAAHTLVDRTGRFVLEVPLPGSAARESQLALEIRDRHGSLVHRRKQSVRASPGVRKISVKLTAADLANHDVESFSWPGVSGRVIANEVLEELRAAAAALDPEEGRVAAVLDAGAPDLLRFEHLLDDVTQAMAGVPEALDRVADALRVSAEPLAEGEVSRWEEFCQAPEQTRIEPPHDPSSGQRLLEPERLVALGAAAGLAARRRGEDPATAFGFLESSLYRLRTYASVASLVLDAAAAGPPEPARLEPMMDILGGWGPGLHDGDFGKPLKPPAVRFTLNDPKVWQPPIWDGMIDCAFWAFVQATNLPSYFVATIEPVGACPGDVITLTGQGFGTKLGFVVFQSVKGGGVLSDPPTLWEDNKIEVVVPEGATCGSIQLLVIKTYTLCGYLLDLNPAGSGATWFVGGLPSICAFHVNQHDTGGFCVFPGKPVEIGWLTCGTATEVALEDENGTVLASSTKAMGTLSVPTPSTGDTRQWKATISVSGGCATQSVQKELTFWLHRPAQLKIDGIEVTQAIQYYKADQHLFDLNDRGPDNSLRLVTNKTAWVRAYLRSGQHPAFDGGQLTGVDGTLTVERRVGGKWSVVAAAIPSQNGPITAQDSFVTYDAERGDIKSSLNFVVPANIMTGLLRFTVNAASKLAECPKKEAFAQTTVDVNLTQTLNAAFITIGYNGPNATGTGTLNLGPPTQTQCQAETAWAMTTFPVSGAANVRIAGTFTATAPLNDPRSCPGCCSPNWKPILEQVASLVAADQGANPGGNWVYYGIINNGIPVNVPGCNAWGATGGLVGSNNGRTYAHEMGHQFGLTHTRCGDVGGGNAAYPIYEPYDWPVDPPGTSIWTMASIGEYGLDINNGNIANPNTALDFMSYCDPQWTSLYSHKFLIKRPTLVPQEFPTGSGAATDRVIRDDEPGFQRSSKLIEPLIHILGAIDDDGNVEVSSVARLETRYLVGNGRQTEYLAQLVDKDGKIISQDHVYRYKSEGCGCAKSEGGCDDCRRDQTFVFKAMLDDHAPGTSLRIVKGEKVVWERTGSSRPPSLTRVSANLDRENNLKLKWKLKKESEVDEDVWVRWSNDDGKTWRALTVGLKGSSANLSLDHLPAGDIKFQIMANDGFYTVSEATDSVEIPPRPPVVSILYPDTGDQVYPERFLHLWGAASSLANEEITDDQFVWYIDDNEVGQGRDIWVDNPGQGRHEVRLEVSDEGGKATATSVIEVA